MSWLITPQQRIPTVIGEPFGGGYFAGYISHTADGNPTHALIVAPRATGATGTNYPTGPAFNLRWKTANTDTAGTNSTFDGAANTAAMVAAGIADHPAANFCVNLSIGGFTDWYLPAWQEMDIAYFNLKPDTTTNNTSWGSNIYSVPRRDINYTATYPTQTAVFAFISSTEVFVPNHHWSSSETNASTGVDFFFNNGGQRNLTKTIESRVRAFRRIAL